MALRTASPAAVGEGLAAHVGQHPARRDAVDPDPAGSELGAERPGEGDDGALGGGVVGVERLAALAGRRGDEHDRARAAGQHPPRGLGAEGAHRGEVDADRLVPLARPSSSSIGGALPDAVVRDERRRRGRGASSARARRRSASPSRARSARRATAVEPAASISATVSPGRRLVARVGHGDARPEAPEEPAHGAADAAAASRDERGLPGQAEHGQDAIRRRGRVASRRRPRAGGGLIESRDAVHHVRGDRGLRQDDAAALAGRAAGRRRAS